MNCVWRRINVSERFCANSTRKDDKNQQEDHSYYSSRNNHPETMPKRKMEAQPKLKLYYFNFKGKGEPIRLFCAYAGLELEDFQFDYGQEFTDLKEGGKLAFSQVPMLEVNGKHQLVQSGAILRYLAKLTKLYPEDPLEAAAVDAAFDQETDAFVGALVATYNTHARLGILLDADAKAKAFKSISDEILPRHLGNVEKMLKASSTGWIAGTQEPSPADFVWYSRFADYLPEHTELSDKVRSLEDYPACKAFVEKFKSLEAIKEYYSSKN
jgi:glutathione S-transferase